jgi:hypothetical protein
MRARATVAAWLDIGATVGVEIGVTDWIEDSLQPTISVNTLHVLASVIR